MSEVSLMSFQMSLPGIDVATSSPVSVAGPTRSSLPDGPTTAPSGPAVAHASLSARQAKELGLMTSGTSGQRGSGSSSSADLQLSLASRLRAPVSSGKLSAKEADRKYQQAYRRRHRARDLIRHAEHRAAKKGISFDLREHIEEIQERIDAGLCEVTGLQLNLDGGRTWDSPSLDRIDPQSGYVFSNTRVVCHGVNSAMGDWGEQKLVEMARAILGMRKQRSNAFSRRLGERLKEVLQGHGSTLYSMTWSEQVTPAGRAYFRLAASVPRTSASAFTGWPTPDTGRHESLETFTARHERMRLRHPEKGGMGATGGLHIAVQLAGWPTPMAGNPEHGKNARPLNEVARLAGPARLTASGEMLTGSLVGTVAGGQLSPVMSAWLMGYPISWCIAADRALAAKKRK